MFAALLLTAACFAEAPPNLPDVFLISADTLRADHLGVYGYESPTSPHLDRLAARSLVFDDALCEVPLTGPSMAAMFTSRFPRDTGVTRNGIALAPDFPTVAETFREAGYATVAVVSNWTLKAHLSRLDRGFDAYDDDFEEKRWGLIKGERDGSDVSRNALDLLDERDASKPLFAWIHYSDPHAPYNLHPDFDVSKDVERDDRRMERVTRRYDSEVAYMDHQIGSLLDRLQSPNAYVVFVADHGESLWEHDFLGHGRNLHQPSMRIALMISGPGIKTGRSDAVVRGVDIGPTLLGLAKLPGLNGAQGVDILGLAPGAERVRILEAYGGAVVGLPGLRRLMSDAGPEQQAVVSQNWKYIRHGHRAALFDLAADPGELRNIVERRSDLSERLAGLLKAWNDRPNATPETAPLSEEDEEALRALGYVE